MSVSFALIRVNSPLYNMCTDNVIILGYWHNHIFNELWNYGSIIYVTTCVLYVCHGACVLLREHVIHTNTEIHQFIYDILVGFKYNLIHLR